MLSNIDVDRHYTGTFKIVDEELTGDLIYNKKYGTILLNLSKQLVDKDLFGKSYGTLDIIVGRINSGAIVTLFNNRCVNNHTQAFQMQQLVFSSSYLIWSNNEASDQKYDKLVCRLQNAYAWSKFELFERIESPGWKVKETFEKKVYEWFDAKITFSPYLNNALYAPPDEEETTITQRLVVEIETGRKESAIELVAIRNKIISLISFATKNNINIEEQCLVDYDDSYVIAENFRDYHKHYLLSSEPFLDMRKAYRWEYNFYLDQLPPDKDINKELVKLEPVFNLYLSLFKYRDMPPEMRFLNIVQALETFHARFFYDDKKEKYVESVKERFGGSRNFEIFEKLLLSDTQKDPNCKHIILVSRLNDLLIGKYDGLFFEYYCGREGYAQTIADTRHYYTHYGKSKEKKALKGNDLTEATYILRLLLEYHVCSVLGIDRRDQIAKQLGSHEMWNQLSKHQNVAIAQNAK